MKAWLSIARDTLRGFVHQKVILAIAIAAVLGTWVVIHVTESQKKAFQMMHEEDSLQAVAEPSATPASGKKLDPAISEQDREQVSTFMQGAFFGFASGCGTLVSLGLFSAAIASPLRRGELRAILARPVTRGQYLLGRTAGAMAALLVFWAMMAVAFVVFRGVVGGELSPIARYAVALSLPKNVMIGCIGMALSLYMRPLVAAALALAMSSDWVSRQGLLYMLLPGDDRLSVASLILHGTRPSMRDLIIAVVYAIDIAAIALGCAWLRFRKLDIA
jgi:hypothetical protein